MIRPFVAVALLSLAVSAAGAQDKVEPKLDKIKKLQIERRDVLKKIVDLRDQEYWAGRETLAALISSAKDLLDAELALATKPETRLAAHAARLKLARKTEKLAADRYEAGRATAAHNLAAKADRLEAEIGWLKASGEEKKAKKDS